MITAIWICAYLAAGGLAVGLAERHFGAHKGSPRWPLALLVLFWPIVFAAFALLFVLGLLDAARGRISGRRAP